MSKLNLKNKTAKGKNETVSEIGERRQAYDANGINMFIFVE